MLIQDVFIIDVKKHICHYTLHVIEYVAYGTQRRTVKTPGALLTCYEKVVVTYISL